MSDPLKDNEKSSHLSARRSESEMRSLEQQLALDNLRWLIESGEFHQWDVEAQRALGEAVAGVLGGSRSHE